MRRDVVKTLQKLGLKKTELQVYLICQANRDGLFAQQIADDAHVKRSSVDLILDRLLAGGYLVRQKIGRRNRYVAQTPETILFKREQVLEDFKSIIPFLNGMNTSQIETDVHFFEGFDGVRQMYQEGMLRLRTLDKSQRRVLAIVSGQDLSKAIPDFENFWIKRRMALKIPAYILCPASSSDAQGQQHDPEKLRYVKNFDDHLLPYRISLEMFGPDMVGLFSLAKPVREIVIRDPIMARSLQCLFHTLWNLLPPPPGADPVSLPL